MSTVTPPEATLNDLPAAQLPLTDVRKPRLWTVFATWLVSVVAGYTAVIFGFIAVGAGVGFVMGFQGVSDSSVIEARVSEVFQQPLASLLLTLVPFQLGIGLVVLLAARWSKEPLRQRLGLVPPSGRMYGKLTLATMAAFTVATALSALIGASMLLGDAPMDPISAAINGGSLWSITLLSVILSTIPAIVEEMLFRGYIQRRLLQRWSPAAAIAMSTLLFAVVHSESLQRMIAVVPLGLVMGLLAYRTKSILPGMLVHAIHNAVVVAFASVMNELSLRMTEESLGLIVIGTIAASGLVGLPAMISLLRRNPSAAPASLSSHSALGSLAAPTI